MAGRGVVKAPAEKKKPQQGAGASNIKGDYAAAAARTVDANYQKKEARKKPDGKLTRGFFTDCWRVAQRLAIGAPASSTLEVQGDFEAA
jgi:hypothetical protein